MRLSNFVKLRNVEIMVFSFEILFMFKSEEDKKKRMNFSGRRLKDMVIYKIWINMVWLIGHNIFQ